MLVPAKRQLVVEDVFRQMRDLILQNKVEAGANFPAERELSASLGVNRSVVREAMKKLEQMRLISIQQGGRTKVMDFRRDAGLELLPSLIFSPEQGVDLRVVRSLMEMLFIVCRDIANYASQRRGDKDIEKLQAILLEMAATDELIELEGLIDRFWSDLIDASQNIAYRMAFNSLSQTYEFIRPVVRNVLEEDTRNLAAYRKLTKAVVDQNPKQAEKVVEELLRNGKRLLMEAMGDGV